MPSMTATKQAPIDPNIDIFAEIARMKSDMDAVILAHYYVDGDVQDVADCVGDSLQLAQFAEKTRAKVIVFAGVHFMAETAKILNPDKLVLVPDMEAGCSLSDSCPPEKFAKFKAAHPGHVVISYVNCSAGIKALSDVIVTSSNAEKIVSQFPPDQPMIFAPDKNLGAYISKKLGRKMVLWDGSCIVHELFSRQKIQLLKWQHPEAKVLAHPECEEAVLSQADYIGSTSGIRKYANESPAKEFIIVTEPGLIHLMKKDCPDKVFIPAPPTNTCACNMCPHMKLNTIEKLYLCMRDKTPALEMDEELRQAALKPIRRMLEMS
ncbi:quinolinate synthase NadA [bacterium]|nr:quinolinate synthase NadA [bacterium]